MSTAVVLLSGGVDSAVLLYMLAAEYNVRALTVDYGQRNRRELIAASEVAAACGVPHDIVRLSGLRDVMGGSSQTDERVPVPHGDPTSEVMRATIVPNRNMVLLSIAAARAESIGASFVAYAPHAGDAAIYADCRPAFVGAMGEALGAATEGRVKLLAPLAEWGKAMIVGHGARLNVPFGLTWTCYEDGPRQCGECGACRGRKAAFGFALVMDPVGYACTE